MGAFFDPEFGAVLSETDSVAGPEPVPSREEPAANENPAPPLWRPLSIQEAASLLHRNHGISIGTDDPIMMQVTLQSRFLQDVNQVLGRHDQAIGTAVSHAAATTANAVDKSLEALHDKTLRAGIDNALALAERQGQAVEMTLQSIRRVRLSLFILSFLNWAAVLVTISILWTVLK